MYLGMICDSREMFQHVGKFRTHLHSPIINMKLKEIKVQITI